MRIELTKETMKELTAKAYGYALLGYKSYLEFLYEKHTSFTPAQLEAYSIVAMVFEYDDIYFNLISEEICNDAIRYNVCIIAIELKKFKYLISTVERMDNPMYYDSDYNFDILFLTLLNDVKDTDVIVYLIKQYLKDKTMESFRREYVGGATLKDIVARKRPDLIPLFYDILGFSVDDCDKYSEITLFIMRERYLFNYLLPYIDEINHEINKTQE